MGGGGGWGDWLFSIYVFHLRFAYGLFDRRIAIRLTWVCTVWHARYCAVSQSMIMMLVRGTIRRTTWYESESERERENERERERDRKIERERGRETDSQNEK